MKPLFNPGRIPKTGLFALLFFLMTVPLVAQDYTRQDTFDITSPSMRFPHQYRKWGFQIGAGLEMVKPPKDLLENAIQAPLVNIHMTFGLPWKFSLEGDVSTIVVSNQIALGPRLGFGHRSFYFNVGYDLVFVYGQLKQAGFNNSAKIWLNYPNISLGYKLKRMAFTLKGEVVYVTSVEQKTDEIILSQTKNFYNGFTLAFYLEQRLWKNHVFIFGIKDNYEKYYWPTWMLFSTFDRYYHIPELSFMWIL